MLLSIQTRILILVYLYLDKKRKVIKNYPIIIDKVCTQFNYSYHLFLDERYKFQFGIRYVVSYLEALKLWVIFILLFALYIA